MQKQYQIRITFGTGKGNTSVAAYHDALRRAGIHEYNFEGERVIIPRHSQLKILRPDERANLTKIGNRGDLLHLALARSYGSQPGREYVAGLGWVLDQDNSGFIVRYPGIDPIELYTKKEVGELIEKGVTSIQEVENSGRVWTNLEKKILSIRSDGTPVAALVAAVIRTVEL